MSIPAAVLFCTLLGLAHGPAAAFDGIRVTLLGTGTADSPARQGGPGTLIETGDEVLLFDCGQGTLERIQRAGLAAFDVTAVFLTSLDREHVEGCAEIWSAARAGSAFQGFSVWGPAGTAELFLHMDQELGSAGAYSTRAFDIADNVVYQPDALTVTAFVSDSDPQSQHFGYRVDARRRAVVLSSHAGSPENIARFARGAELMMQEVSGRKESDVAAGSSVRPSPEEAGRLFRASRPYLAVYSHVMVDGATEEELLRRTRRIYRGPVHIGRDLMVIEVQNEVQIRSAPSEPRLR
jgi:ribonuclease Z